MTVVGRSSTLSYIYAEFTHQPSLLKRDVFCQVFKEELLKRRDSVARDIGRTRLLRAQECGRLSVACTPDCQRRGGADCEVEQAGSCLALPLQAVSPPALVTGLADSPQINFFLCI